MDIYVAHSTAFDYQNALYNPIKNSKVLEQHNFILPHLLEQETFSSKTVISSQCDLMLAEVSYPSTGLGMELGWAEAANTPVLCIYQQGAKIPSSLPIIFNNFIEYSNTTDLIEKLAAHLL